MKSHEPQAHLKLYNQWLIRSELSNLPVWKSLNMSTSSFIFAGVLSQEIVTIRQKLVTTKTDTKDKNGWKRNEKYVAQNDVSMIFLPRYTLSHTSRTTADFVFNIFTVSNECTYTSNHQKPLVFNCLKKKSICHTFPKKALQVLQSSSSVYHGYNVLVTIPG